MRTCCTLVSDCSRSTGGRQSRWRTIAQHGAGRSVRTCPRLAVARVARRLHDRAGNWRAMGGAMTAKYTADDVRHFHDEFTLRKWIEPGEMMRYAFLRTP